MSKQVYISGALTNANRKQFYEEIAQVVNSLGYKAYVPHMYTDPEKNPDVTPTEVYELDMEQIENSCLVIAYVGIPSFGVGMELERASSKGIPIILLHHNDDKVSRMALGIINDKIKVTKKGKIKITKNGYFFDCQK